jgi:hypothetical protein
MPAPRWYPAVPWVLLAAAVLPLGIPPVTLGGVLGWTALGFALAGAASFLVLRRRWTPSRRLALALPLAAAGYGLWLTRALLAQGEDALPDGGAFTRVGPPAPPADPGRLPLAFPPGEGLRGLGMRLPDDMPMYERRFPAPVEDSYAHGPDLKFCARIGELLAVTVDADHHVALAASRNGHLRHYSYPDFHLVATYRLIRPAYRAVLDGRHGLLYLAGSEPEQMFVGPFGEREGGRGDIEVYDVQGLLDQKSADVAPPLVRVRTIALPADPAEQEAGPRPGPRWARPVPAKGYVADLLLSPDGETLYYLADFEGHVRVGRVDARRPEGAREQRLPRGAANLRLTRDGKHLYATRVGKVLQIDPVTLRVQKEVAVEVAPSDLAVTNAGLAFLGEWGQMTSVTVVDMSRDGVTVGRWTPEVYGPLYLGLSPDEKRLYVSSPSPVANCVRSLLVTGDLSRRPPHSGEAVSSRNGQVWGEFFLTPDGQFLINRWGKIYRLYRDNADDE